MFVGCTAPSFLSYGKMGLPLTRAALLAQFLICLSISCSVVYALPIAYCVTLAAAGLVGQIERII